MTVHERIAAWDREVMYSYIIKTFPYHSCTTDVLRIYARSCVVWIMYYKRYVSLNLLCSYGMYAYRTMKIERNTQVQIIMLVCDRDNDWGSVGGRATARWKVTGSHKRWLYQPHLHWLFDDRFHISVYFRRASRLGKPAHGASSYTGQ